ncbi:MAG: ISAs1 family transposase, partial [Bacteroidota bacterium]
RLTKVYDVPQDILSRNWTGVERIIVVERSRRHFQQTLLSTSYYLSSIASSDAGFFTRGIRNHWLIENKLHYVKDVILNEDNSLIRKDLPASNISLLKTIALNLFRTNGFDSVKNGISFFANKIKELFHVMRT